MAIFTDLSGQKFGRLLVIERAPKGRTTNPMPAQWICKCDCGETKIVISGNLTRGITRSCGCLQSELSSKRGIDKAPPPEVSIVSAIFRAYKQGAKRRGLEFSLTKFDVAELVLSNCEYCGKSPSRSVRVHTRKKAPTAAMLTSGIDRKHNHLGYTLGNCAPCCTTCNDGKKNMSYADWLNHLDSLVAFRNSKR